MGLMGPMGPISRIRPISPIPQKTKRPPEFLQAALPLMGISNTRFQASLHSYLPSAAWAAAKRATGTR